MKDPRGRHARWLMELENYDNDIEYIPGKTNSIAYSFIKRICCCLHNWISTYANHYAKTLRPRNLFTTLRTLSLQAVKLSVAMCFISSGTGQFLIYSCRSKATVF
ncbi:hypothetical protein RF11_11316 [Thelohanellus kitauei]|uniref:Uncharacterized protein n=1 Tax=Thelohanellus kitauei TaxID=669202 RepID=A0A0C2MHT5_THEKT|nr:hypothetical protein RF11_11316 [Thelohanellus kitauei]